MSSVFAAMSTPARIELATLLGEPQLGLALVAGDAAQHPRLVQWVHPSDLDDPSPFLAAHTVLLTTGTQFDEALEPAAAEAYVNRLIAAGTTALGFGSGVRWDRIPPAVVSACERMRLPLFRVPYDTPFIAVVRAAARLLEAEAHAAEQRGHSLGEIGSLFGRRRDLIAAEQSLRSVVLKLLLARNRDLAHQIASSLLCALPREHLVVLSFSGPLSGRASVDLAPLASASDGVFTAQDGDGYVVVAETAHLAALRRTLERHNIAAGTSERGTLDDLPDLLAQAERAAEVARRQHVAGVLEYRPAMHAGVLQLLDTSPEALRRARTLLAPLHTHDTRDGDDLIVTLRMWLAHHGQPSSAAAALGVHRHTVRTRIRTAEARLQRDLDDPDVRAEIWAALRLTGE